MFPAKVIALFLALACLMPCGSEAQDFSKPVRRFTIRDGLAQQQARAFWEDSRGYIWIGCNAGFSRFDGRTLKAYSLATGFSGRKVYSFREAPNGDIWYRSADTVYRFNGRTEQALPMTPEFWQAQPPHLWPLITSNIPALLGGKYPELKTLAEGYALINDTAGAAVIIDWPRRVSYRILDQCVATPLPPDFPFYGEPDVTDRYVVAQHRHYTWADNAWQKVAERMTPENTALLLHPLAPEVFYTNGSIHTAYWYRNQNAYHPIDPGTFNRVDKIWMDSRRRIFVATDEGLGLIYPDGPEYVNIAQAQHPWSVLPDEQGNCWIASHLNGLFCVQGQKTIRHFPLPADHLTHQLFPGKLVGPEGALIFGGYKGVYRLQNGALDFFFLGEPVEALCYDASRKCYWVAGSRIYAVEQSLAGIRHTISLPPDIAKTDLGLSGLALAPDGQLWAAGYHGIARLTPDGQILFRDTQSGPGNCLLFDQNGNLWLGTQKGLFRYDTAIGRFVKATEFLFNNPVNNLVLLPRQQLAVITDTEVYLLDVSSKEQPELRAYWSDQNGFQLLEAVNNGAAFDGEWLWIPAGNGIQRINLGPYLLPYKPVIPRLRIDRIQNELFSLTQKDPEIPAHGRTAEVWLSVINLNADHFALEYSVNGSEWRTLEHPLQGTVTGLAHGSNRVIFRANIPLIHEANWPHTECTLSVELPLWERPWMKIVMVMLVCLLGFLVFISWKNRKSRQKLQNLLRQTQLGTVQAQLNPHILFNLLTSLQNSITNQSKKEANEHLMSIARLIREILELSFTHNPSSGYKFPTITLKEEIRFLENYLHLEAAQYAPAFVYEIRNDAPDNLVLPPLLVQPLVENAILHGVLPNKGKEGRILVHFSTEAGHLAITVSDNGVGLEKSSSNTISRYRSRGGELLQERLRLLQQLGFS
ncbi:MAG: histidine kinase, partial [Saprospiraceae bacterium]|nr:histidine kinase [Saprospiraceae bacterium]